MIVNLLEETLEVLKKHGKSPKDVKWVGSEDGEYAITWDEFEEIADFLYDPHNIVNIAYDLVIVGKDWWLERYVYTEAEGWSFKALLVKQPNTKKFKEVAFYPSKLGRSLKEYNPVTGEDK